MINHETPKVAVVLNNEENTKTIFEVSGLRPGIADGYASSLRINLLQFVPSLKPIAVNILGVSNAQARIAPLTEPINRVIQNIQKIVVKPVDEKNYQAEYKVTFDGEVDGELTLGMMDGKGQLDFVNPDTVILTTATAQRIELEIFIIWGTGFVPDTTEIKLDAGGVDKTYTNDGEIIRIDADFSPVIMANFKTVENSPVEGLESVFLDIETNGSITPQLALSLASQTLISYLEPLEQMKEISWTGSSRPQVAKLEKDKLTRPIEFLALEPEEYNELKEDGIVSLRDLLNVTENKTKVYSDEIINQLKIELANLGLTDIEETSHIK